MMAPVNLIFASDENYLKYTAVTLASVLKNFGGDRQLNVYILTDRFLSEQGLQKIRDLRAHRDFELENVIVDASQFAKIRTTPGITLATYYRLVMHDVLPLDVERCIYLDSDIIIRRSLEEIYDVPMDGFLFAGVQDSISYVYNRKFSLPTNAPHINAGVTIVNVKEARASAFSEKINDYLDKHRYLVTLGDQQIINAVFYQKIKYIPVAWNVHGSMFLPDWRKQHAGVNNSFSNEELTDATKDPAAIHYTYKRKPWVSMEHPRAAEWWDYAIITPFFDASEKPAKAAPQKPAAQGNEKPSPKTPRDDKQPPSLFSRLNGYLRSVARLRETRLTVHRIEKQLYGLSAKSTEPHPAPAGTPQALVPYYLLEEQSASLLASIGTRDLPPTFDARSYVADRQEHLRIFTNGEPKDLDGGFHENIKTILKTGDINRNRDFCEMDEVLVLVQRLRQDLYWKALYAARYYQKNLIFAETTFFGAFATYYDEDAPPPLRKSFGYILDDMGYYFDARSPSRLEAYLNSDSSILSPEESAATKSVIDKIIRHGITKYNFNSRPWEAVSLPPGSILVIDQKANDASIEFAAASNKTFETMLKAALDENPEARIFLKPHPDNLGKNRHLLDSRIAILPTNSRLTELLEQCAKVYTVSSQVGFEGLLRGKEVHCFGLPFYAGWGLTQDRQYLPRRKRRVTMEELFHAACIQNSVYVNPFTGRLMDIEDAIEFIIEMRDGPVPALVKGAA